MNITTKMSDKYVKNGGNNCPRCDSELIYLGEAEFIKFKLKRPIYCRECKFEWDELFMVSGIYNKEIE